ncbi:hypothetical protein JAAARDRAFT_61759 [Jaapia argillacea MUCL 33604]|uniref:Uncharacterized protein n=1 Tax=Jaapia argillacea MUCL 33604 TaxID=933084 RepID=A0A067PFV1_9AGAM|nr:hypothetical protein JAAARDRAFT_61759 [Jaapia argillacea MUCL 33604]
MGGFFSRNRSLDLDPDMGKPNPANLEQLFTPDARLPVRPLWRGPVTELHTLLIDFPPVDSYRLACIEHLKGCDGKPYHECLVVQFEALDSPSVRWMRLDRFINADSSPSSSTPQSGDVCDRLCQAEHLPPPSRTRPSATRTSTSSSSSPESISNVFKDFLAEDKARVALAREDLFDPDRSTYELCQKATYIDKSLAPTLRTVLDLLNVIEEHYPEYKLIGRACFWFASTVWEVIVDCHSPSEIEKGPAVKKKGRPFPAFPHKMSVSFSDNKREVRERWVQSPSILTPMGEFFYEESTDAIFFQRGQGCFFVQPIVGEAVPLGLDAPGVFQGLREGFISKVVTGEGNYVMMLSVRNRSIELRKPSLLYSLSIDFTSPSEAAECFSYILQYASTLSSAPLSKTFRVTMWESCQAWLTFRDPLLMGVRIRVRLVLLWCQASYSLESA